MRGSVFLAVLLASPAGSLSGAGNYPITLVLDATASQGTTAIATVVTIRVDRLMEENRRKRVTDALTYSGYGNFLNALRVLPAVGAIEVGPRRVEVRYAHEQIDAANRRLVLVADRPLFFLAGDLEKARAGYELTLVELQFDASGGVTGTISGAARVKPSPGGLVIDDYAAVPVRLAAPVTKR